MSIVTETNGDTHVAHIEYSFGELFYPLTKGITKLTEEAVYNSIKYGGEFIPLWGGQHSHKKASSFVSVNGKNKDGDPIRIFQGECLIISLDGSAGSMTYKPEILENGQPNIFALNHHAGILRCKNPKLLNLEYFKYRFENVLRNMALSSGSKTLTLRMLKSIKYDLPPLSEQLILVERYKKIDNLKETLEEVEQSIDRIQQKKFIDDYLLTISTNIELSSILEYTSRNDSLSEEGIYNRLSKSANEITVLSGSSGNLIYGNVGKTKDIHTVLERQCLHVITRGKAGKLTYIPKGNYATNTNAFLFTIKKDAFKKLGIKDEADEQLYLKFLKIYLEPIFIEWSSNSDVSVFPLTKIMEMLEIPLFEISEKMLEIVQKYEKLYSFKSEIKTIIKRCEELLAKEII